MEEKHNLYFLIPIGVVLVLIVGYLLLTFIKPAPVVAATSNFSIPGTSAPGFLWPHTGEAAIGAEGYGVLAASGDQTPQPTASVAKIMNALLILKKYPLKVGEQGPTLTITRADVALYNSYVAKDGSVTRVAVGEKITEYQALQALLLPSSDNMADTLANWAYGSITDYAQTANGEAQTLGMNNTEFSTEDTSGLAPDTISTAHDLVLLGQVALQNPVIAQIVAQTKATIPVAGTIRNVNSLLGTNGINGIKTGNSNQAGGVYLFSAKQTFANGQSVTLIGAVMDTSLTLSQAMGESQPLLQTVESGFKLVTPVHKGQVIGTYRVPWGGTVNAVAAQSFSHVIWMGQNSVPKLTLLSFKAPLPKNTEVGEIDFGNNTKPVPIVTAKGVVTPGFSWRFAHAL